MLKFSNFKYFNRLASTTQAALTVPGTTALDFTTTSGVKGCLMESKVTDTRLAQYLKKDMADLTLVVKAGTRFEKDTEQQLGVAHGIKSFSLLTHQSATALRTVGSLEFLGAEFGVTLTRELIIYKLHCDIALLDQALPFVTSALNQPEFYKWEIAKAKHLVKLDSFLFHQDMVAVALDLLHTASFRKGLGNSLATTDEQVDALTKGKLLNYYENMFTPSNAYLVCNNVPGELIEEQMQEFGSKDKPGSKQIITPSQFIAGELRSDDNTKNDVVVAIASESGATNTKDAIVNSLLAHLLQGKSDHSVGQIDLLQLSLDGDKLEWAKAFQCDYSDAGLFGFLIYCQAEKAGLLTKELMTRLVSVEAELNDDHVIIAKNSLFRALMTSLENPSARADHMASQLILGCAIDHAEYNTILQSVTKADLKSAMSKFLNGPKSIGANGNCSTVPYLDQL